MQPRFLKLLKSRRAVSAVISNMILVAAVIAVGFAMLGWAQSQSSNYTNQYGRAISSDINQLQERIVLEWAYYNSTLTNLKAYLMNSGTVNVTIQTAYVGSQSSSLTQYSFTLYNFQNQLVSGKTLNATTGMREGYVLISPIILGSGSYLIRIITARGSAFVFTFAV
jgi:predicted PurR-regulated permease PerM